MDGIVKKEDEESEEGKEIEDSFFHNLFNFVTFLTFLTFFFSPIMKESFHSDELKPSIVSITQVGATRAGPP